jgi:hypothetical protein
MHRGAKPTSIAAAANDNASQSRGDEPRRSEASGRIVDGAIKRKPVELRIRQEIKGECDIQRTALSRKEEADARVRLLENILKDLLSQVEFIDLLKSTGFTKMPRLIHQRLSEQAGGNHGVSDVPRANTYVPSYGQSHIVQTATGLIGKILSARTIQALNRMTAQRQVVASNLMAAVDNYSGDFAHALLAATPENSRATVERVRRCVGGRTRSFATLEKRLIGLLEQNHILSTAHNTNLLFLAVCGSCIRSWVRNCDVFAWLRVHPRRSVKFLRVWSLQTPPPDDRRLSH